MRSPARVWIGAFALGALGALVAACSYLPGAQGDPNAPVLIRGRVLDADGNGIGGAGLQVMVSDLDNVQVGQNARVVYQERFSAAADGSFAIHLAPNAELVAAAARNNGFVNFDLIVSAPNRPPWPWAFPRELEAGTWAGEPPSIEAGPDGVTEPGADPGVPAPLPAAT